MKWSLTTKHIDQLTSHPYNARDLTGDEYRHIERSIRTYGMIDKPVVNLDDMVIGGHQRIQVLRSQGVKHIDCWVPDRMLTQDEVDELNIRLNRNHADWAWDMLGNNWDADKLVAWGFDPEEIYGCKSKGRRAVKPTITIKFATVEQYDQFATDPDTCIRSIREGCEYYGGKLTIRGVDGQDTQDA